MHLQNPFICGDPVKAPKFVNREDVIRQLVNRIVPGWQSTALIGMPRAGKTSVLLNVMDEMRRTEFFGGYAERICFSYIDAHMATGLTSVSGFWSMALKPLLRFSELLGNTDVAELLTVCRSRGFDGESLLSLFESLERIDIHLVLLIDEFDLMIHIPILNERGFFGELRSIATRHTSLSLIIASSQRLTLLEREISSIVPSGSPYFNFLESHHIGSLPSEAVTTLLDWATPSFSLSDRQVIRELSGSQPFLLQGVSAITWDTIHGNQLGQADKISHIAQTSRRVYQDHFVYLWQRWTSEIQIAFTSAALLNERIMFQDRTTKDFMLSAIEPQLKEFQPELEELQIAGVLDQDSNSRGGWNISSKLMLWWLADEVVRNTRSTILFEEWIRKYQLYALISGGEKERVASVLSSFGKILDNGISKFVEGYAQGLGSINTAGLS